MEKWSDTVSKADAPKTRFGIRQVMVAFIEADSLNGRGKAWSQLWGTRLQEEESAGCKPEAER